MPDPADLTGDDVNDAREEQDERREKGFRCETISVKNSLSNSLLEISGFFFVIFFSCAFFCLATLALESSVHPSSFSNLIGSSAN